MNSYRGHDAFHVICMTRIFSGRFVVVSASVALHWRRPATAVTAASCCQRCAALGQPKVGHLHAWRRSWEDTPLNLSGRC